MSIKKKKKSYSLKKFVQTRAQKIISEKREKPEFERKRSDHVKHSNATDSK